MGNKKILLIDDNEQELMILKRLLNQAGYENLVFADGGDEGIEKAKAEKPDLIVLDINMPKRIGIEISQIIKQDPTIKNIPIIYYTNLILPHEQYAGANDVFPKASCSNEIIVRIKELIG
jgi:CheY-like chemotaxis protein